jgi:hypothetical protein
MTVLPNVYRQNSDLVKFDLLLLVRDGHVNKLESVMRFSTKPTVLFCISIENEGFIRFRRNLVGQGSPI